MLRAPRSFPYSLLLPATIVMLAVVLFPLGYSFWLAFRNVSLYRFRTHGSSSGSTTSSSC